MKIFSGTANKPLAQKIAKDLGTSLSPVEIHIFPDGEKRIMLEEEVAGEHCIVIEPTAPPVDTNIMELCLLLDACKRSGAESVTAVVPYLGYQRQDHTFRVGEARSLEVVIRTIEGGATTFIGVDFHSIKIPEIFRIGVVHLSALPLFAKKIKELCPDRKDTCLVTPDMGGIRRIELLSDYLGGMPYVSVEKDRDVVTGSISPSKIHGRVEKTCFIVDDMISSGKTIVQAVEILRKNGAKRIVVFATHPIFSDEAPRLLEKCHAEKIFVTDTVFVPEKKHFKKLETLSIASTIAKKLKELI